MKRYKIKLDNIYIIIEIFIFIMLLLNIFNMLDTIIKQDVLKGVTVLDTVIIFILNVEIINYILEKKNIL